MSSEPGCPQPGEARQTIPEGDYMPGDAIMGAMAATLTDEEHGACYHGLSMTAEEYLRLPEDPRYRYELIDGVVCMSPSPWPTHQWIITRFAHELLLHVEPAGLGKVYVEVDVYLGRRPNGRDLVYRPDSIFLRSERIPPEDQHIECAPDLIVEVISAESRQYDGRTKKSDYERAGVAEYWLIDPMPQGFIFYRLKAGRYVEVKPVKGKLSSQAVPGFLLDVRRISKILFG